MLGGYVGRINYFMPYNQKWYWPCNVHAFCYACVNDDNTVNDYCKAAVIRASTLYAPAAFFKNLESYWCDDDILGYIKNGTYCGYDASSMHSCEDGTEFARI